MQTLNSDIVNVMCDSLNYIATLLAAWYYVKPHQVEELMKAILHEHVNLITS